MIPKFGKQIGVQFIFATGSGRSAWILNPRTNNSLRPVIIQFIFCHALTFDLIYNATSFNQTRVLFNCLVFLIHYVSKWSRIFWAQYFLFFDEARNIVGSSNLIFLTLYILKLRGIIILLYQVHVLFISIIWIWLAFKIFFIFGRYIFVEFSFWHCILVLFKFCLLIIYLYSPDKSKKNRSPIFDLCKKWVKWF